ncbi:Holliday junction resolvase-like protein [Pyrobaculum aerophilum]|uniref:Holliday junction resolvase-related domain-containing protein n=1 Tax=Pyrobaculum aerophilum TaxID=13773 RepID=A0A371QUT9_9CREN|nr:Holliday junction resolvase-like protein [Pyrobaculum aerophilum]RFA93521.1 hypothetical protein CGL51_12585 [Pyrobaculum aerophilum]RFA99315.1 hypothetical protein CGL52_03825 [Pyrobaculum aerophilum]
MLEVILLFIVIVLALVLYHERAKVRLIQQEFEMQKRALEEQLRREIAAREELLRRELAVKEEQLRKEAELKLAEWIKEKEREIREDAIRRSVAVLLGRVGEQMAPLLMSRELNFDPRDCRYIGTPVDYVVFKGLSDRGEVEEILFVEVKTGKSSSLSERERAVRKAVENKRVRWVTYNLRGAVEKIGTFLEQDIKSVVEGQMQERLRDRAQYPAEKVPEPAIFSIENS